MTKRDWWIGIGIIVVALVLHAALPRYDWRQTGAQFIRIDRWTGRAEHGGFFDSRGWVSVAKRKAETAAAQEAAAARALRRIEIEAQKSAEAARIAAAAREKQLTIEKYEPLHQEQIEALAKRHGGAPVEFDFTGIPPASERAR